MILSYAKTVVVFSDGESSVENRDQLFEIKTEADSNDIAEHPHDGKSRPYLCTVCYKQFTTKDNLNYLKRMHSAVKRDGMYSCTQCGKRYLSQRALSLHMNIHGWRYKCRECGKCCRSSRDLAVHRRSHSGEKPFECTVYSKRFTQSGHLVKHSRIHNGVKPYKCHLCDKAFSQSTNLNTHMRVHTGEKPYKCSLCDKSFSVSSNLQLHKRRVHSNVDRMIVVTVGCCLRLTVI